MPIDSRDEPALNPLVTAGLLLAALPHFARLQLEHPTAVEVLKATGASKSRAYDLRTAVEGLLPTLLRRPGRPRKPRPSKPEGAEAIVREAYAYLRAHPGAVTTTEARQHYHDGFRHFVLALVEGHPELDRAVLADAVGVPWLTLKEWLDAPRAAVAPPPPSPSPTVDATGPRIESVLAAWRSWNGGFKPFCTHVRKELRIPYGRTLLARILSVHTDRRPRRRLGRSPDEKALRDAFLTFFPGAQWTEDGSPIQIAVNDETFTFNWELCVDVSSDALTGASLRDEEDGRAVAEAFQDGVSTTGAKPLALGTDNRASNHAPEVDNAIGDTFHVRSTLGRPQSDCHVEGTFGLFQQTAPPLIVHGTNSREIAHSILDLVLKTWGRATNNRPRADRQGKSRVQLYEGEQPTDEQITAARVALDERRRRQELAYRTRQARLDPTVRSMIDKEFARLGLNDPTGNVKDAIARYPHDAVLAGIATFEGKRVAKTLPPDAGSRYLLGIVRNISDRDEGRAVADALWRLRLEARDHALLRLEEELRGASGTADERTRLFLDRALTAVGPLHRSFWLHAAGDLILEQSPDRRRELFLSAARRIHATFRVDPHQRQAAVRTLAERVLPCA